MCTIMKINSRGCHIDYFPEMKTFIDFMQSNEKVYPEEIVTQILKFKCSLKLFS